MEEKLIIEAKRKNKTPKLLDRLQTFGFTKVASMDQDIVLEKMSGEELSGKALLDYRIILKNKTIECVYSIGPKETKRKRLLKLFPIFLNMVLLIEDDYEVKISTLFKPVSTFLMEVGQLVDKDAVDLAATLEEVETKQSDLAKKYAELVRSSEENARLLLECERRRDELEERVKVLERLSDDTLKEELYKCIKLHEGTIELSEFCESYGIPMTRAEEGLELLVREGYIKRRND